jgi:ribonuclease G
LQTIDVNSGSTVKAEGEQSLAAVANLRAVPEIARQIRLRNLSGIILIDFIDMDSERERQMVLSAMEEAVRDDRVKNVIHGFTRLGLLEMTRKRTGESLRDLLTDPCSKCCETGRVERC